MNESELENELRALRPAAPSPRMERAIFSKLEEPPRRAERTPMVFWWLERLLWSGGGALAVWLLGLGGWMTKAPQALQSLGMTEEQIALTDEGVSMPAGESPKRVLHRTAMERHTWADAKRGGVLEVMVPREDVIFLPVKMQ